MREFPSPIGESFFLIIGVDVRGGCKVSVPYRGIILSNIYHDLFENIVIVSVPYRGIILSNEKNTLTIKIRIENVSVPYRGIILSNVRADFEAVSAFNKFPSPIGESFFLIMPKISVCKFKKRFPSPIGESFFLISAPGIFGAGPLVSVPYRGIILSNRITSYKRKRVRKMFPSPIGESFFLIKHLASVTKKDCFSFRPLSGNHSF